MKNLILSGLTVHAEQGVLPNSAVAVQNNKILQIGRPERIQKEFPDAEVLSFAENFHLVPGFIDLHVHGANGSDVMDAAPDALRNISQTLLKEGTTSFLATTMTATSSEIENVLCVVRDVMHEQQSVPRAAILGVHLEGPFISEAKANAQQGRKIFAPKKEYIERWQKISNDAIKLVTLAPELPNISEFIRYLKEKNIIASIGHTNATFAETVSAIAAGCSHATHLFNAMRGLHQREPGAVTAALLSENVMAELIVDGVHLHPAIVELVLKLKGKDKIALVTDAMRAKCLGNGVYDLGGQAVTVKDNVASLSDGTLAGSVLSMSAALRNFLQFTGCTLTDALKMTSENPAKALGIFARKGSIAVGKDADLVVLDDQLNVVTTFC